MDIIFDIKIYIASWDSLVWYKLTRIDNEFNEYSNTSIGINKFIELFYKCDINGDNYLWSIFGRAHSYDDNPAEITKDKKKWYKNGFIHRGCDLPAIIYINGLRSWYKNGELWRESDLPSLISQFETQVWHKNNKIHRDEDLPAIICVDGTRMWYKNGEKHRNGNLPAVIYSYGLCERWNNGMRT